MYPEVAPRLYRTVETRAVHRMGKGDWTDRWVLIPLAASLLVLFSGPEIEAQQPSAAPGSDAEWVAMPPGATVSDAAPSRSFFEMVGESLFGDAYAEPS